LAARVCCPPVVWEGVVRRNFELLVVVIVATVMAAGLVVILVVDRIA
jgi:hypothetical protein